jgi:Kef-type K+ transport system membrane component KefB
MSFVAIRRLDSELSVVDLTLLRWFIAAAGYLTLLPFLRGMAVGWSLQRDGTEGRALPLSFGAWLVPRGEFSLIIGQFALTVGLIDTNLFSLVGLSVLVTAIVGPLLHRFFSPRLAEAIHLIRPETD